MKNVSKLKIYFIEPRMLLSLSWMTDVTLMDHIPALFHGPYRSISASRVV